MSASRFLLCALATALPIAAAAQEARSTKWVNLRAGPARDYPLVNAVGPGTPLMVQGCTANFHWCDVLSPGNARGWVYAGNIAYSYQSAEVPVIRYGPTIGLPIVTFVIGTYWRQHYRYRPWYGNQAHWAHRPGAPPRPIVRPPTIRPPVVRPPGIFPPGNHRPPPTTRPPGGGRPRGGGPPDGGRPSEGGKPRPQPR